MNKCICRTPFDVFFLRKSSLKRTKKQKSKRVFVKKACRLEIHDPENCEKWCFCGEENIFFWEFVITAILSKLRTLKLCYEGFGTKALMTSKTVCFSIYRSVPLNRNNLISSKQISFVCNKSRKDNSKSYSFGGVSKCMENGASAKLQECLLVGKDTKDSRFKLANDKLRVLIGDIHNIFVAGILYHKKCFSSYLTQIRKKRYSQEKNKTLNKRKECEVYVLKRFLNNYCQECVFNY